MPPLTVIQGETTETFEINTEDGLVVCNLGAALLDCEGTDKFTWSGFDFNDIELRLASGASLKISQVVCPAGEDSKPNCGDSKKCVDFVTLGMQALVLPVPIAVLELKILSSEGTEVGVVQVKEANSSTLKIGQLKAALEPLVDGLGANLQLEVASKRDSVYIPCSLNQQPEQLVLELVQTKFPAPPIVFGEPPSDLSKVAIKLGEGATFKPPDMGSGELAELQKTELAGLQKALVDWSKKKTAAGSAANLEMMKELAGGDECFLSFKTGMTTVKHKDKSTSAEEAVLFECSLCADGEVYKRDAGHGGSVRHVCQDKHVKNFCKQQQLEEDANNLAWHQLPKAMTKYRRFDTTQHTARKAKKQRQEQLQAGVVVALGGEPATAIAEGL